MNNPNFTEYDLGIPSNHTWNITDSTKLKCLLSCERMYFFEYVLGWRSPKSIHLSYGGLIHDALHALNVGGFRKESEFFWKYLETMTALGDKKNFMLSEMLGYGLTLLSEEHPYRVFWNQFPEEKAYWDAHKNPVKGLLSLVLYDRSLSPYEWYTFKNAKGEEEKAVELGGTISIGDDKTLSYRLDGLSVEGDAIIPVEFKTGRNSSYWLQQWDTDIQITIYSIVSYLLSGELKGLYIHGLLLNSTTIDDKRGLDFSNPFRHVEYCKAKIYRHRSQLNAFLSDLDVWWERLHKSFQDADRSKNDSEMRGFPRNYKNCASFYGRACPYVDYCHTNPNVLKRVIKEGYLPAEFDINYWNPLEDVKKELNVEGKL